MLETIGFNSETIFDLLTQDCSGNIVYREEFNSSGVKFEDVATEGILVDNIQTDRLFVAEYPIVNQDKIEKMTLLECGGEVIFVTDGIAEITFAPKISEGKILKSDLVTAVVKKDDLIIATDTPNNWTKIYGEKFEFIDIIGNLNGPRQYELLPKKYIPVII